MRYLLFAASCATVLASSFTPATAETLQDALRATSSTNPQLEAQRVANTIAEEQLVAAKGARRPTVEVTAQYGPETIQTNRLIVLDQGGRQIGSTSLSATQPLYAGGRITAGIREARAGIGASEAQLKVIEQDTYLDTIVAYVDVRRDRETIAIRANSVALLEEQFRAAGDRFEVGEITRTDVALSEARLERAKAQLAGAEAQLEASIATYEFIIGMTPGDLAPPPEITGVPASFEAALATALEKSPDIEAAEFNERAAEQRVKAARSRLRPQLNLVATAAVQATLNQPDSANFFGPDPTALTSTPDFVDRNVSAFAQARIPLYQGGVARSQVRSAKHAVSQARLDIEARRRQTVAGVSQAWHAYRAATVGITASRRQEAAAQIAFEGGQEELAVGVRTTLDVLDQEQDLLEARLGVIEAERDAYVAVHQLFRAMGELTAQRLNL